MVTIPSRLGATALDVGAVRRDFPILERLINGRPLVYLDSGASSQKPVVVIEAERQYYLNSHANIHRGVYVLSEEATLAYEQAHEQVGQFINAAWDEVIFTKNTTESLNLVAYAWGLNHLQAGDEVVATVLEHHSNIVPWQQIARRTGATVRYIGITHYTSSAYGAVERELKANPWDFLQINYSLGERDSEKRILPLAKERGVAVIINRPFQEGVLFQRTRNRALPAWAKEYDINSWAQHFLKWIVSHPAVTCAIPGTGRADHMRDNLAAGHGIVPDEKGRRRLAEYFDAL